MLYLSLFACSSGVHIQEYKQIPCDTSSEADDDLEPSWEDTAEPEEDTEAWIWDAAELALVSPEPSAFIALGEEHLFEAVILDSEGNQLDFTDIEWTSSVDQQWSPVGDSFEDTLSAGNHIITAQARLPNGDRLSHAVGGVLVQHPDAGIYAGTTSIDVTINYTTPIVVSCSGGVTLTVEPSGESGYGEGDCIVNINGGDVPSTYIFELDIDEGDVTGSASLDLWLVQQAFPLTGSVGNGEMTAEWADSVLGFIDVVGAMSIVRVSLY